MRRTLASGEVAAGCGNAVLIGVRQRHDEPASRAPPAVQHQVGGNPEQIRAAVRLALPVAARPQEPVVALLQQVVGELRVAGHAREVAPERPRRPVVERAERVFVHLERHVNLCSLEPFDVGEGQIALSISLSAQDSRCGRAAGRAARRGRDGATGRRTRRRHDEAGADRQREDYRWQRAAAPLPRSRGC